MVKGLGTKLAQCRRKTRNDRLNSEIIHTEFDVSREGPSSGNIPLTFEAPNFLETSNFVLCGFISLGSRTFIFVRF